METKVIVSHGNANEFVFPIIGGDNQHNKEIYGTCFKLKDNVFITAGHVIKNAASRKAMGIGFCENQIFQYFPITEYKIINDLDVALFKATLPNNNLPRLEWTNFEGSMMEDVCTMGFPFGLKRISSEDPGVIFTRAFKGYFISTPVKNHPKHFYHELSFNCPKGISGAPLIFDKTGQVIGLIIGNSETSMIISQFKETVEDERKTIISTSEMTLFLGIALASWKILDLESELISGKIGDFLSLQK